MFRIILLASLVFGPALAADRVQVHWTNHAAPIRLTCEDSSPYAFDGTEVWVFYDLDGDGPADWLSDAPTGDVFEINGTADLGMPGTFDPPHKMTIPDRKNPEERYYLRVDVADVVWLSPSYKLGSGNHDIDVTNWVCVPK